MALGLDVCFIVYDTRLLCPDTPFCRQEAVEAVRAEVLRVEKYTKTGEHP